MTTQSELGRILTIQLENGVEDVERSIQELNSLRIGRLVLCEIVDMIDIHWFSDASMVAYGA